MNRSLSALVLLVGLAHPSMGQLAQDNQTVLALQTQLTQMLIAKDPTKFLSLIASSGVTFGVDGDKEFKEQIREQFDQKRGAYCVLFESKCLVREAPRKRESLHPCSVHDLVNRPGWSMEHKTGQYDGNSQISLALKPNNELCSNGKDPIEFVFIEFNDGWKLVAVLYE